MPELSLYLADEDDQEFVSYCFSQGAWMVPDLLYKTPAPRIVSNLDSFAECAEERLFFIQHASFLCSPLLFAKLEKNNETVYSISQRYGGPAISLFCRGQFLKDREVYIGPGSLSHYPTYRNTITGEDEKPPESLRQLYALLVKHLKRNSFRIKPGIRVYWIGMHARELLRQGAKLVGYENVKIEV